jgi:hypothetical protein
LRVDGRQNTEVGGNFEVRVLAVELRALHRISFAPSVHGICVDLCESVAVFFLKIYQDMQVENMSRKIKARLPSVAGTLAVLVLMNASGLAKL